MFYFSLKSLSGITSKQQQFGKSNIALHLFINKTKDVYETTQWHLHQCVFWITLALCLLYYYIESPLMLLGLFFLENVNLKKSYMLIELSRKNHCDWSSRFVNKVNVKYM